MPAYRPSEVLSIPAEQDAIRSLVEYVPPTQERQRRIRCIAEMDGRLEAMPLHHEPDGANVGGDESTEPAHFRRLTRGEVDAKESAKSEVEQRRVRARIDEREELRSLA